LKLVGEHGSRGEGEQGRAPKKSLVSVSVDRSITTKGTRDGGLRGQKGKGPALRMEKS